MTALYDASANYRACVLRRQALAIPGYETFADVGLEGNWTTPYHLASASPTGPVLLTYNYLDAPSARTYRDILASRGFLAHMPFNRVLDLALASARMTRADVYVTHAFHLLPERRSQSIPMRDIETSFEAVARDEILGRRVVALGDVAARICARHAIPHTAVPHLSARGLGFAVKAKALADALV